MVMLVGFIFAVSIFVRAFAEDIYASRKQGLESIVSLALNAIDPVLKNRNAGKITGGEARIRATEIINQFTYNDNGASNFVFLATYEGYILVEPFSPDAVGTYQMQRRDTQGTPITKLLLDKAKAGGGFVEYYEARSPGDNPQKKISYVVGIPEIECYLGTGIYVDDLDGSINELKQKLMLLGFLIIAAVLTLQYYFMRPMLRCLYWLSDVFKNLSENPDRPHSFQPPPGARSLDTERLLVSLRGMMSNFHLHKLGIEQSAEKYKQIAYATNDVIWEWDRESQRTTWSGNMKELVGYEPAGYDAHFEVLEDWVHPDDRKKRRQTLASYFSGAIESYTSEYRLYNRADEEYRWVLAKGIATFNTDRTPLSAVGSIITIPRFMHSAVTTKAVEQLEGDIAGSQNIGDIIQPTPCVSSEMLVVDVKKRLDSEQWQGIVIVQDDNPIGLIMRDTLNYQLSGQYGASLYYGRQANVVMDDRPLIVDAEVSLEQVASAARKRPEAKLYDLIIVTQKGEYQGTVSVMELLSRITDLRLKLAANANPLTGLPGNIVIAEKLKMALQNEFAALYIDLDNFKAFNDKYGFEMGDKAIKLTAFILKEIAMVYNEKDVFVAHIGGDDFLVLIYQPELAASYAEQIIGEFDARISNLYLAEDLDKGFIAVLDRRGNEQRYPVMSISIAVVDSRIRHFTNYLEISEVAAQLKHKAKMVEGSTWVSERSPQ
jgi:diguanylate cyclase (GGDEF)-like protein/PAS domain S-box-containing protein